MVSGALPHESLWWLFLVTVAVRGRGVCFWTRWSFVVVAAVSGRGRGGSRWLFVVVVAVSGRGSCSWSWWLFLVAVL